MERAQRIRQSMAEKGYEKTVEETKVAVAACDLLMAELTLEQYLYYKNLTDEGIVELAAREKSSLEETQGVVEILCHVGKIKFGF